MLIGVDWGGTKIEALGLSSEGAVLARERIATPRGDYEGCIAAIADLVGRIEAIAGRRGTVGVGIPGAISPRTGLIMNANSTWNIGRRLDRDLERALGREVRVENDANCFAVSEAVDGAGAGASLVWGVILGTGAGSGIAIDGRAIGGRNRIAGEWGHNPLPRPTDAERPGPLCYCGRHGCNESFVSGTGFEHDYRERAGQALPVRRSSPSCEAETPSPGHLGSLPRPTRARDCRVREPARPRRHRARRRHVEHRRAL
jgi:fructokinase